MQAKFLSKNLNGTHQLGDSVIDYKVLLKCILIRCEDVDLFQMPQDRIHDIIPLGSRREGEFLEQTSNYLLPKDCIIWSQTLRYNRPLSFTVLL
jgi:hypothetical protein